MLDRKPHMVSELPEPELEGVYHQVKRGETLWRIAKTYDVALSDIIRVNNIPSSAGIEENQLLFIPGVYAVKEIILDTEKTRNEFIWPLQGQVIRFFHQEHQGVLLKGIDIKAFAGETVKASRAGVVVFADDLTGYGRTVILDHLDGYYSVYAHNAEVLVNAGDQVIKNQDIARVAAGNREAFLHFEIRRSDIEDNPLYYLP